MPESCSAPEYSTESILPEICFEYVAYSLVTIFRLGWSGKGEYSHVGVVDHFSSFRMPFW